MILIRNDDSFYNSEHLNLFRNCALCPRNCNEDKTSDNLGYCNTDSGFNISSICLHKGEEPPVSGDYGICNIFYSSCNLQCVYCQNYQISRNSNRIISVQKNLHQIIDEVSAILHEGGQAVGFVSPAHNFLQTKFIIKELRSNGFNPIFVLNTNAYEKASSIRRYEGLIDVYLPDFKYADNTLAKNLSDCDNYFDIALKVISEMFTQKGSSLPLNSGNYAENGLIIRHLVLPGFVENSISVLRAIAEHISTEVHISLMSQYHPVPETQNHPTLSRSLTEEEYSIVTDELESLGFESGWVQEHESAPNYLPDFEKDMPFKV